MNMNDIIQNLGEWLIKTIATVGIAGGTGLVIYRHFFLDRKQKQDTQEKLIDTLKKMAFDSMDKLTALQKDVDYWRREYNELGKSTGDLQKKYEQAIHENELLKKSMEKLSRQYTDLKSKYDELAKQGHNITT